jgi:ribosomal protein S18 acetylase RimI-like enzyme
VTVEETLIWLELTSPGELVPARLPPTPLELDEVGPEAAPLLRSTYVRIGAPHGWAGRTAWTDDAWEEELAREGVRAWIARVKGEVAGFVELEADPPGTVGIVVLGLVPELVGRGFGGELLTRATRLAWDLIAPDGTPTTKVVVETSSRDHPHAIRNYERRGFRAVWTRPKPL